MALTDLGIHERVADLLAAQGIQELYPPQREAWEQIRGGGNVVAAIPTASGKSLIAYLAILHRWLAKGKKALYIVPLRALASEKHEELGAFSELGFKVALATGDLDEGDTKLGRFDVIVCTSEKADSLLRHRAGWLDEIGCVVADELHLVHDAGRGPTLEVILSRFRGLLPDVQIVGLSATIQNAPELARWLGAELVESTWRPVELRMGTYLDGHVQFLNQEPKSVGKGDPVTHLVEDTIHDGGQCLVFVSTRRSAEAQAKRLAPRVRELLSDEERKALAAEVKSLEEDEEDTPTAQKVRMLAKSGVAYHTAGLTGKQRRFLESRFRAGQLKVLTATPTLAAGVNTPARRVIVRDMSRFEVGHGSRPLPVLEVHQMMGRAGRPRYDPHGEAILVAKDAEMQQALVDEYLLGEPEPISSKLAADAALRIHTLASIAGGYCRSHEALRDFLAHTLWAEQSDQWIIEDRLEDVLWFLEDNGFMERDGGRLKATLFGKRTSDLYIDPLSALRIRTALDGGAQPDPFGLLQVVAGCPDVYPLYLRRSDDWVQERLWEQEGQLLIPDDMRDLETALSTCKTALLFMDWIQELHPRELEERYQVGPGDIQARLETARWLTHAFRELARSLRPDWQKPLTELGMRLDNGIKAELLPLVALKGVGRLRARTLYNNGYKRPKDLKEATTKAVGALPGFGPRLAASLIQQVGGDPDKEAPDEEPKGQVRIWDFKAKA